MVTCLVAIAAVVVAAVVSCLLPAAFLFMSLLLILFLHVPVQSSSLSLLMPL